MTDPRYLTPDERLPYKWLSNLDRVDDLLASHDAADEMLAEARAVLTCAVIDAPAGYDGRCPCPVCTVARRIDDATGGGAQTLNTQPPHVEDSYPCRICNGTGWSESSGGDTTCPRGCKRSDT